MTILILVATMIIPLQSSEVPIASPPTELLGANVLRGQPISLFDGETTQGWVHRNGKPSKNWQAKDGALSRVSGGGDLYHEHWYTDFEWKLEKNGNSGVKYRVQAFGNQMLGCEYQLQDDKGKDHHLHATGGLYAVYEPLKNKKAPLIGDWNTSKIVVCGQRLEHWLNGDRILTANFGDADWYARVNRSKFKHKAGFGLNREGRIFLQDHGNPVSFRKIVVVPLDSSRPPLRTATN